MRWPWQRLTRTDEERTRADREVAFARSHLRVLVNELNRLTDQIADKRDRMASNDA